MHADGTTSGRSPIIQLWSFLTLAAVGTALIEAGFWVGSDRYVGLGAALTAFAALAFLFVQFWKTGISVLRAPPAALLVPSARPIEFTYPTPRPIPGTISTTPPATEDLVEFELVEETKAPTTLQVPEAFQVEEVLHAAPPEPGLLGPESGFVPATERRQEIVAGLPLLSQIFAPETAASPAPAPQSRPGKTRGRCSSCGTMLWAPTTRPLRLRCPKCGHVRTLTD